MNQLVNFIKKATTTTENALELLDIENNLMHKQRACISTYSQGLEDSSNTNIVKEHCKDLRTHREEQQISQFDY